MSVELQQKKLAVFVGFLITVIVIVSLIVARCRDYHLLVFILYLSKKCKLDICY